VSAISARRPRVPTTTHDRSGTASRAQTPERVEVRLPRSLSLRLAAVYGLLVSATVLVVAGVTVTVARRHLDRSLDGQLRSSVASFQHGPAARARTPAGLENQTRRWLAEHPLPEGQMAAVRIVGGGVLTSAGGLDLFEVEQPRVLLTGKTVRWWNLDGSEGGVRALTVPILADGRQLGTLVLLAYEKPIHHTLGSLLRAIGIASVLGLALALLVGVAVVRRSLRPLTAIATEAAAIESTCDLSRRIELQGGADEIDRLAGSFDRMLARLEAAFQQQRRFLADAAHELRTPLTVTRGQLEVLADELGDAERASFLVATDELDRMARLVDDLLLLASLDEGVALRSEPVEIDLVMEEALLRGMLLSPRQVNAVAAPGLSALADPDRLLQVLTNLISNAVKHTDKSGRITLEARRDEDSALIRVSDNGCGIPPAELPHVFERFYRGARERGAPDGSGLGLAIADALVAAMHGTIDVDSTPARGTTFTIRVPLAHGSELHATARRAVAIP
jgi:signal transduction histidine kinase